jgi:hypothetical protein
MELVQLSVSPIDSARSESSFCANEHSADETRQMLKERENQFFTEEDRLMFMPLGRGVQTNIRANNNQMRVNMRNRRLHQKRQAANSNKDIQLPAISSSSLERQEQIIREHYSRDSQFLLGSSQKSENRDELNGCKIPISNLRNGFNDHSDLISSIKQKIRQQKDRRLLSHAKASHFKSCLPLVKKPSHSKPLLDIWQGLSLKAE